MHCRSHTLSTYDYEFTCIPCGHNVSKRKNELTRNHINLNFINPLIYAQHKMFCSCKELYKSYEVNDIEKLTVCLKRQNSRELNIKKN